MRSIPQTLFLLNVTCQAAVQTLFRLVAPDLWSLVVRVGPLGLDVPQDVPVLAHTSSYSVRSHSSGHVDRSRVSGLRNSARECSLTRLACISHLDTTNADSTCFRGRGSPGGSVTSVSQMCGTGVISRRSQKQSVCTPWPPTDAAPLLC
ncbi:hypothetical protein BC628DRAFT_626963 [Trametes gibbosa]|nr:hypothetical protein BC628DRAFT_626963 [Trametes gibbosa]